MPTRPNIEHELSERLQKIGQALRICVERSLPKTIGGLTMQQLRALKFVYSNPGTTMGDVAKEFRITKASTNALIKRLLNQKWLKKHADKDDRRITRLTITPQKLKGMRVLMEKKEHAITEMLKPLPKKDKQELLRILQTISLDAFTS